MAVLGGIGNEGEAASQFTIYQVAARAALGCGPLRGEHAVVVTVERGLLPLLYVVAFRGSLHQQRTNRARRLVVIRLPEEAVLLALIADELVRVVLGLLAVAHHRTVLALRIHQGMQNLDGVVLIGADPAIEHFLYASLGVEVPRSSVVLYERDGRGPVLRPHVERCRLVGLDDDAMHEVVAADEVGDHLLFGNTVTGVEYFLFAGTENAIQHLAVVGRGSVIESEHGIAGRSERLLIALLGNGRPVKQPEQ